MPPPASDGGDSSAELQAERDAHEATKAELAQARQRIAELEEQLASKPAAAAAPAAAVKKPGPPPQAAAPVAAKPKPPVANVAPPPPAGKKYRALYDFKAEQDGDLGFKKGDIIFVTAEDGAWWTGECNGNTGTFPSNYVSS
jgi:myosin-1